MKRAMTLLKTSEPIAFGVASAIARALKLPALVVRIVVLVSAIAIPEITLLAYAVSAWALHRQQRGTTARIKTELDDAARRRIEVDTYVIQSEAKLNREFEELRRG